MSERGSFVTEYIYCDKCLSGVRKILGGNGKYLKSIGIPHWNGGDEPLPIIAGKIGGLYEGEELVIFQEKLIPEIENLICHPVRIAVLADHGQRIFELNPVEKNIP